MISSARISSTSAAVCHVVSLHSESESASRGITLKDDCGAPCALIVPRDRERSEHGKECEGEVDAGAIGDTFGVVEALACALLLPSCSSSLLKARREGMKPGSGDDVIPKGGGGRWGIRLGTSEPFERSLVAP